jgi:phosphoglycerate dehydrogenase-like enzyme
VTRHTVFITSPLEAEHVARLRAVAGDAVEVLHYPELHPPLRYAADHNGAPGFTRTAEQERVWLECLGRADILFDFPADMGLAPRVRWVQTTSTGVGQLVHKLGLQDSEILVTTARGVHGAPLAEFVMLGLLAHFRGLRHLEAEQKAHRWVRYCGDEMAGKTVVILGAGDLARETAMRARAFGMRTVAVTRRPEKPRGHGDAFDEICAVADLHTALGRADALVLTTPHTPETERLMDRAALLALKPGAAFVNIARGQVVDEQALIEGLQAGRIAFAALDVAAVEPLPDSSPLWDMANVLISPHSASTVYRENERITDIFCHNLCCWVEGRLSEMKNILDKRLMY